MYTMLYQGSYTLGKPGIVRENDYYSKSPEKVRENCHFLLKPGKVRECFVMYCSEASLGASDL